ncbi:3-oxoacyl-ACP reductase [Zhihengliuella flava]|uniref:3-oxoacyl-[acyl-carrier protein] reductase n=1 Tax=Zhihengliuella flava TaxID=1285193 RepID=A0A931GGG8_9MICC|nr:3-oxoacyl-ACP reductase [Zhihengliuella flava]MBG6085787.1 3-oxoacyl-[acyl-carrier protein] reductase [Zhihengliuella flava]
MTNQYQTLVNQGLGRRLARQLGLPRPPHLRRYRQGQPLVPGPVVVLGSGTSAQPLADVLLAWGLDVVRHLSPGRTAGAAVVALDDVAHPSDLSEVALELGAVVKSLAPGGRVVSFSRPVVDGLEPEVAAARHAVDGMMRSLGRELRGGATSNGVLLRDGLDVEAPSAQAALRFLLSGRSAYVDGQFIEISDQRGELPDDWDQPLAGKVAVVTGAARGIGAAIARTLSRDGAQVVCVDVPAAGSALATVANDVQGTALQLDVTRPDAGHLIIQHARQRHGGLDIVVHNAGITRDKLLANMDAARWNSVLAVNLESQLRMNDAFLTAGLQNLRVVSLASTSGIAGNRGQTNYAASKGGVMGMVAASRRDFAELGGGINAVAPGFIETEMTAKVPLATRAVARMIMPSLMQGGLPEDVAEAIGFLASGSAGGINGGTLRVCGQSLIGR